MSDTPFPATRAAPRLSTLIVFAALGASAMNIFIPSLQVMADYFGTSYAMMQLSISLYLAMSGVLQIFIGPLSDRYGRRRLSLAVLAIFMVATIGAMLAPNVGIFLACRMVQAVIATSLSLSRTVVKDLAPPKEAAAMMGWLAMGFAVVPMFFPAIGGFLEEQFGWQATFLWLLLFGGIVSYLVLRDLPETSTSQHSSLLAQIKCYPDLFRAHAFWGYALGGAFGSAVIYCHIGVAAVVGNEIFTLKSSELGMFIGMTSVGYILGSLLSTQLSKRVPIRQMLLIGAALTGLIVGVMIVIELAGIRHPALYFGGVSLVCLANGLLLPAANVGMMSVRPDLTGSASGLGSALMIGAGALSSTLAALAISQIATLLVVEGLMLLCSGLALLMAYRYAKA